MTKTKKMGIIFIIIGAFIPTILYPFAEPTREVAIVQGLFGRSGVLYQPRLNQLQVGTIPYHYILAVGITLAFIGVGLIALTGMKIKKDYD